MIFRGIQPQRTKLLPGETLAQRARQLVTRYRRGLYVLGAGSAGYMAYNFDEAPITRRWRIQAFSIPRELELAKSLPDSEEQHKLPLVSSQSDVYRTTKAMLDQLLFHAEQQFMKPEERRLIPWRVRIVQNPTVNAYCGPGGNIVVYTGLIDFCARAQELGQVESASAALSGVLCHEISHGIARHSMETLSWLPFLSAGAFLLQLFLYSLGFSGNEVYFFRDLFQSVTQLALQLPHSRKLETEADLIACAILTAASFPTDDFPRMLALLADANSMVGGGKKTTATVPEILSTHPDSQRRAKETAQYLAKLRRVSDEDESAQVEALLRHGNRTYLAFSRQHKA